LIRPPVNLGITPARGRGGDLSIQGIRSHNAVGTLQEQSLYAAYHTDPQGFVIFESSGSGRWAKREICKVFFSKGMKDFTDVVVIQVIMSITDFVAIKDFIDIKGENFLDILDIIVYVLYSIAVYIHKF
jgi:hypothetical protein